MGGAGTRRCVHTAHHGKSGFVPCSMGLVVSATLFREHNRRGPRPCLDGTNRGPRSAKRSWHALLPGVGGRGSARSDHNGFRGFVFFCFISACHVQYCCSWSGTATHDEETDGGLGRVSVVKGGCFVLVGTRLEPARGGKNDIKKEIAQTNQRMRRTGTRGGRDERLGAKGVTQHTIIPLAIG